MAEYPELRWTPELVARFWNHTSRNPDQYFTFVNGRGVLRRMRPFLAGRGRVLDYGCGSGHLLDLLLQAGHRAGGIDFSNDSIKAVRERFDGRRNFLGAWNLEHLLEDGRRFDAVLIVEVIEHLYDDVLDDTLDGLKRLVEPSGVIIFTTPNEERLEDKQVFCPCCEHVFHRWQHVRSWSEASLSGYLEERGFDVVAHMTTDFGAAFWRHNRRKRKVFQKNLKYALAPATKRPHLMVVARLRHGDATC